MPGPAVPGAVSAAPRRELLTTAREVRGRLRGSRSRRISVAVLYKDGGLIERAETIIDRLLAELEGS